MTGAAYFEESTIFPMSMSKGPEDTKTGKQQHAEGQRQLSALPVVHDHGQAAKHRVQAVT